MWQIRAQKVSDAPEHGAIMHIVTHVSTALASIVSLALPFLQCVHRFQGGVQLIGLQSHHQGLPQEQDAAKAPSQARTRDCNDESEAVQDVYAGYVLVLVPGQVKHCLHALQALNGPYVAEFYASFEDDGAIYIIMELW